MNSKRFCIGSLAITLMVVLVVGGLTAYIDPYFHYRGPAENISYSFGPERYMNDGITRNCTYNAIITGTSMTENFKTSELDELFLVNSIKVPYSGATYKEVGDNLRKAFATDNQIAMVVRGIDFSSMCEDADYLTEDFVYPEYLTNETVVDDLSYLLNKEVFLNTTFADAVNTIRKKPGTAFDDYGIWRYTSGRSVALKAYKRPEVQAAEQIAMSGEDREKILTNLQQNVIELAKEHSDTEFYLFFPPYSILYWDDMTRQGKLQWHYEMEKMAIEALTVYDNIHLFSFNTRQEMITNLEDYIDACHYTYPTNSWILQQMQAGTYELTQDNYEEYLESCYTFYRNYDYEAIFQ